MKTYKEDEYSTLGDILSKKDYSEIIKTSHNKISIKKGLVLLYKGRRWGLGLDESGPHDDELLGPLEVSTPLSNIGFAYGFSLGSVLRIDELADYELKKTCAVYVKINFAAAGDHSSLIDIGNENGSYDGTILPYVFGLLSKKSYYFDEAPGRISYEVHETEPDDSDDESLATPLAPGYAGYFYIKIADIELTNGRFKIKQRHRGPIPLSPVQIYFGAYELTQG